MRLLALLPHDVQHDLMRPVAVLDEGEALSGSFTPPSR